MRLAPSPHPDCLHCGTKIPVHRGDSFCCAGCAAVYQLLQARGLGEFYSLQKQGSSERAAIPAEPNRDDFSYLDEPESLERYSFATPRGQSMRFFLEGAHCAACIWLTEKLGEQIPGIERIRLDLGESVATVYAKEDSRGSFARAATELARVGYQPIPISPDGGEELRKRAERKLLARTGVAAACAGNIMLLSTSLYAGVSGNLGHAFQWIAFALSLPVLLYSAQPFYRNAWVALRSREISIDIPISLGILIGAVSSVYNLFHGSPFLYFDSLTMLVFLMLASRYVLSRSQTAALQSSRLIHFLTPARVRVGKQSGSSEPEEIREVPLDQVRPGDWVEALPGDCIAADGVVVKGSSAVNASLLTGESRPEPVSEGDRVFMGTINEFAPIWVRAETSGTATRLGRILRSVQDDQASKARITGFADRVSRYFVAAVLISVVVVFWAGLRQGLDHAVNLALALSIVTCPCAFALATPLAFSRSIARCARKGILIRGASALERLSEVRTVLLDKTGTLTYGEFRVVRSISELKGSDELGLASIWVALETRSRHPVARAIVEHFSPEIQRPLPEVQDFRETFGQGVSGVIEGRRYRITGTADGTILLSRDGRPAAMLYLADRLRPESARTLELLRSSGYRLALLSGDSPIPTRKIAGELGIERWSASQSPEDKKNYVQRSPRSLMVGDGANDAPALACAHVGVAVRGGMEASFRSSDIYCKQPGIESLPALLTVGRETMRIVHRNLAFSLVYNAIGIAGVLLGWVTPLFAAVLMPISAFTVFASSLAGTRQLRKALG